MSDTLDTLKALFPVFKTDLEINGVLRTIETDPFASIPELIERIRIGQGDSAEEFEWWAEWGSRNHQATMSVLELEAMAEFEPDSSDDYETNTMLLEAIVERRSVPA